MIDLTSRHDPLTAKRFNAAPGQQDTFLVVNDTGDDRGFDRLFFEFHNTLMRCEMRGEKRDKAFSHFAPRASYFFASLCIAAMRKRKALSLMKPSASAWL